MSVIGFGGFLWVSNDIQMHNDLSWSRKTIKKELGKIKNGNKMGSDMINDEWMIQTLHNDDLMIRWMDEWDFDVK